MTLYSSKSLAGFIDDAVGIPGGKLPADAVEITSTQHAALLAGQSAGQVIQFNDAAAPTLAQAPVNLALYAQQKMAALVAGGFTVTLGGGAVTFATDAASEFRMTAKALRLQQPNAPTANFTWPDVNGAPLSVAPADFIAAAEKIADFVQAVSDLMLLTVIPGIAGKTISTTAQIDAVAWPANRG